MEYVWKSRNVQQKLDIENARCYNDAVWTKVGLFLEQGISNLNLYKPKYNLVIYINLNID